jgi:enterochelin esterase-like enzyme
VGVIGNLTVVSSPFLIGLMLVGLLVWAVALRVWLTGRRVALRIALASLASLLTLMAAADYVNAQYSYLPNVSDVVDAAFMTAPSRVTTPAQLTLHSLPARGKLLRLAIPDRGSGFGRTDAWVWLPENYFTQPAARFPVVYLFHGSPGMPKDWFHGGDAASIAGSMSEPVIVVAPQMSHNWLDDPECVDGRHEKVESHLVKDVIPTVDASLRTIAERSGRIFGGMSAGGYCALNMGLRHRDLTATVLDLSGETVPTHAGGLKPLFGQNADPAARQNSPASYVQQLRNGPPMRIWLDCGSSDHAVLRQLQGIAPSLRAAGMTVQLRVRPGGHSYSVWRPALRQALAWSLQH